MLKRQNIVIKLIIINTVVFVLLNIIRVGFFLFDVESAFFSFLNFFSVPSNLKTLILKFWTPLTYMFVHIDFFHILANMLWLFFMGVLLIEYIDEKDFLTLYILGGIAGIVMYLMAYNIFPVFADIKNNSWIFGASASVSAIVIALATYKPNKVIYLFGIIRIKMVFIAVVFVFLDILLLTGDNSGGHFAHLGGAVYGFIYAYNLRNKKNIASNFSNFISRIFFMNSVHNSKIKVVKNNLYSKNDYEYNATKLDIKNEIDRILDKISKNGYQSLTNKEKDFLNKFKDKI